MKLRVAHLFYFFNCLASAFLFGCFADENQLLLNPPASRDSLRVLNLSYDLAARSFSIRGNTSIENVSAPAASALIGVSLDSAITEISRSGKITTSQTLHFPRNAYNSYIIYDATSERDTIFSISSPYSQASRRNNVGYVRFFNTFSPGISVVLGCPNGKSLASTMPLGTGISGTTELLPDTYTFSVLNPIAGSKTRFFQCKIEPNADYTIFVSKTSDGYGLFRLNERESSTKCLLPLQEIGQGSFSLKAINTSELQPFSIYQNDPSGGNPKQLLDQVLPLSVSATKFVTACQSQLQDTLFVSQISNFSEKSRAIGALEVDKSFTTIISDSSFPGDKTLLIPPLPVTAKKAGKAIIRTVNVAWSKPTLDVSIGARTASNNVFSSGEVLARTLVPGTVSEPVAVNPGILPLTIFTSYNPRKIIVAGLAEVQPDSSYLCLVSGSGQQLRVNIVPENSQNVSLNDIEQGSFSRFINSSSDGKSTEISHSTIFKNVTLFSGDGIATVLPIGNQKITVSSQDMSVNTFADKRTLAVIAGSESNLRLIDVTTSPMEVNGSTIKRRVINAAEDATNLSVYEDVTEDGSAIAKNLSYSNFTNPSDAILQRRFTMLFSAKGDNTVDLKVADVYFLFGRYYSIIFSGKSGAYRATFVEEY